MKRTLITIGAVVILVLLIVRMIFIQSGKEDTRRQEFVSRLNYRFSARVDSVALFTPHASVGMVYLMPADTVVNREKKASRAVDEKRRMKFLDNDGRGRVRMFSKDARSYTTGDSVYVDSSKDKLQLFHEGALLREFTISEHVQN